MKKLSLSIALFILSNFLFAQKTEIIVIGNIHQAVPNYNSDTIISMIKHIQPDYLLHELDTSFFNQDFTFKAVPLENEGIASVKYIHENPKTKMRPFDFEGRNEYRKIHGFNPTEGLAIKLLDSLYKYDQLNSSQSKIYKRYVDLLEPLKLAASKNPLSFNNIKNDEICKERQYYQYTMLLQLMDEIPAFKTHYVIKKNGEKISYYEGFKLASEFWDTRNQTMARNILKIAYQNPGKRIVVLTGFMHRYYIISELQKLTKDIRNIELNEFYHYNPKS